MLSDSPLKITSSDTGLTKQYTDNEKIECIKLWMVTGNFTQTAAALSISIETVRKWKNTQWWADLVKEFKLESKLKLSDKLRSIAHKALAQVEDF